MATVITEFAGFVAKDEPESAIVRWLAGIQPTMRASRHFRTLSEYLSENDTDAFDTLIASFSPAQLTYLYKVQDPETHETLLHRVLSKPQHPQFFISFCNHLPAEMLQLNLWATTSQGVTSFELAMFAKEHQFAHILLPLVTVELVNRIFTRRSEAHEQIFRTLLKNFILNTVSNHRDDLPAFLDNFSGENSRRLLANITFPGERNILHILAEYGYSELLLRTLRYLFEEKRNELMVTHNSDGFAPIHDLIRMFSDVEFAAFLTERFVTPESLGTWLSTTTKEGKPAIHFLLEMKSSDNCRTALSSLFRERFVKLLQLRDGQGRSALYQLINYHNEETTLAVLARLGPDIRFLFKEDPLAVAEIIGKRYLDLITSLFHCALIPTIRSIILMPIEIRGESKLTIEHLLKPWDPEKNTKLLHSIIIKLGLIETIHILFENNLFTEDQKETWRQIFLQTRAITLSRFIGETFDRSTTGFTILLEILSAENLKTVVSRIDGDALFKDLQIPLGGGAAASPNTVFTKLFHKYLTDNSTLSRVASKIGYDQFVFELVLNDTDVKNMISKDEKQLIEWIRFFTVGLQFTEQPTDDNFENLVSFLQPHINIVINVIKSLKKDRCETFRSACDRTTSLGRVIAKLASPDLDLPKITRGLFQEQLILDNHNKRPLLYRSLSWAVDHYNTLSTTKGVAKLFSSTDPGIKVLTNIWNLHQETSDEEVSSDEAQVINTILKSWQKLLDDSTKPRDPRLIFISRVFLSTKTIATLHHSTPIDLGAATDTGQDINPREQLARIYQTIESLSLPATVTDDARQQALLSLQGMKNLINGREEICAAFRKAFIRRNPEIRGYDAQDLFSLVTGDDGFSKIPIHFETFAYEQEMLESHDRLVAQVIGIFRRAQNLDKVAEFCNHFSTGYCLEGRTTALASWAEEMEKEITFEKIIQEACMTASKFFMTQNLDARDGDPNWILDFMRDFGFIGLVCQADEEHAPRGRIEAEFARKYIEDIYDTSERSVFMHTLATSNFVTALKQLGGGPT